MRSKTWTLHAISLCLLPLLTAGCLSDNLLSDHPSTSDKPLEIRMKSYIAGSMPTTRVDAAGEGMIEEGTAFSVKFAQVKENKNNTDYPDSYEGTALSGSVNELKVLSFNPPAYYQTTKTKKIKLIGWYPASGTLSNGVVSFAAIDGKTDIMATSLKEGSQNSKFSGITFTHQLTQISVKVYAETEAAKTLWGGIKSIQIKDKKQACTLTLPVTSTDVSSTTNAKVSIAFSDENKTDLPLVQENPADNKVINQGESAYGTSNPLALGVASDGSTTNAVLAGYAMFAPVAANNSFELTVETVSGGTQTVTVSAGTDGFVAGQSYVVTLKFGSSAIEPGTVTVTGWQTGAGTEIPV